MTNLQVGDIVTRKSYGGDLFFKITDIRKDANGKSRCVLKGLMYRIEADSDMEDLLPQDSRSVMQKVHRELTVTRYRGVPRRGLFDGFPIFSWLRGRTGRILHIDSSSDFMERCIDQYSNSGIRSIGKVVPESEQPNVVKRLLEQSRPDILVVTGHDSLKKNAVNKNSIDSYSNSRYYIECVKIARKYEPSKDKLCIFAGACQSYYEALMEEGANFASSPGRILIHALDPAIICEKIALTDSRRIVSPQDIIPLTKSGKDGVWGINTKGHYFIR